MLKWIGNPQDNSLVQLDNGIIDCLAQQVHQVPVARGWETKAKGLSVFAERAHTIAEGNYGRSLSLGLFVQRDLHGYSRGDDAHLREIVN